MAKHYSTKDFFRHLSNASLSLYFREQGLFSDLDFTTMKEGKPDELFAAWLDLPDAQRNKMDAEFRDIFEMSCEKGFRAIIDEARWHLQANHYILTAFIEKLSVLPNHYERAMITYLDDNAFWKGATRFYHADTLQYWRKRKNLSHQSAAVDEPSLQQLAGPRGRAQGDVLFYLTNQTLFKEKINP